MENQLKRGPELNPPMRLNVVAFGGPLDVILAGSQIAQHNNFVRGGDGGLRLFIEYEVLRQYPSPILSGSRLLQ
jgi:hypothetical protein